VWVLVTAALAAATFVAAALAVAGVRRRPVALVLPLALAVWLGFEAIVACALSPARLLTRGGVLAAHLAALAVAGPLLARAASARASLGRVRHIPVRLARPDARLVAASLVPLAVVLAHVAAAYAPGNSDSMTYRLARVAHGIQHRSVAP
jgi:hypothetical protein